MSSIYRRGSVFWISATIDGKRVRRLACYTQQEAERSLADLLRPKSPSVADVFSEYWRRLVREHPRTAGPGVRGVIRRLTEFLGADRPASDVTTQDVERYAAKRLGEGIKKSTFNRDARVWRAAWRYSRKLGHVPTLPSFELRKSPPAPITTLPQTKIKKLLEAANRHVCPVLELAAATGLRRFELCSLTCADVVGDILHVRHGKGDKPRTIALHSEAAALCAKLAAGRSPSAPLLVTKHGNAWNPERLSKSVCIVYRAAGLHHERAGLHEFRRTVITALANANVPLPALMSISGHSTVAVVQRYIDSAATSDDAKRAAAEALRVTASRVEI